MILVMAGLYNQLEELQGSLVERNTQDTVQLGHILVAAFRTVDTLVLMAVAVRIEDLALVDCMLHL